MAAKKLTVGVLGLTALAACSAQDLTADPILRAPASAQQRIGDNGHPVYVVSVTADGAGIAASVGARPLNVFGHAIHGFTAELPPAAVTALRRNPHVISIEPDTPVHAYGQVVPTGVDRMETERLLPFGSGTAIDVDVAVIDTGILAGHEDLNVFRMTDCAIRGPYNSTCKDGSAKDGHGHGTHVAGTIGALDNDVGVVGVAPGARIWAVRVLNDQGNGYLSWIAGGIDWVAAHAGEIEVANMSLGGNGSDDGNCGYSNDDIEHQAICGLVAKGVVVVVAAGNEGDDAASHRPAAYDEVITVSALSDWDGLPGGFADQSLNCRFNPADPTDPDNFETDDSLAYFSNYGADVDIMAPGYCITSTWNDGGYNTISGTSMASPHVAGLVALYMARQGVVSTSAADTVAIRDAIAGAGLAQDSACGLATDDDDDGFSETLAFSNATLLGGDGSCGEPTCAADVDCDDGLFCNGAETCDPARGCVAGVAPCADDGDACTDTVCDEDLDQCLYPDNGTCCDVNADCDDGDDCTDDVCNPDRTCSNPDNGTCVPVGIEVLACSPSTIAPNQRLTVAVSGAGFATGAAIDFGAGIALQSLTFVSDTALSAAIKASNKAALGPRDVTVTNPDGSSGVCVGCLTVQR
ncbi:MAG: S8 family serine peptidase [Deltaproteobacteria bacterium]|nr:S8 family serine peptidase [Deltaproteobacteria bacterium]